MDQHQRMIQACMAHLLEHFDTVEIFVTKKEEEVTTAIYDGGGNWYARYGQIKAWVIAEEKDFIPNNKKLEEL